MNPQNRIKSLLISGLLFIMPLAGVAEMFKLSDGTIMEGETVNGEPYGHWTITYPDGQVDEGEIVNGQQHGYWTEIYPDGRVRTGQMVNGKAHGQVTITYPDGTVEEVRYRYGHLIKD